MRHSPFCTCKGTLHHPCTAMAAALRRSVNDDGSLAARPSSIWLMRAPRGFRKVGHGILMSSAMFQRDLRLCTKMLTDSGDLQVARAVASATAECTLLAAL